MLLSPDVINQLIGVKEDVNGITCRFSAVCLNDKMGSGAATKLTFILLYFLQKGFLLIIDPTLDGFLYVLIFHNRNLDGHRVCIRILVIGLKVDGQRRSAVGFRLEPNGLDQLRHAIQER